MKGRALSEYQYPGNNTENHSLASQRKWASTLEVTDAGKYGNQVPNTSSEY